MKKVRDIAITCAFVPIMMTGLIITSGGYIALGIGSGVLCTARKLEQLARISEVKNEEKSPT